MRSSIIVFSSTALPLFSVFISSISSIVNANTICIQPTLFGVDKNISPTKRRSNVSSPFDLSRRNTVASSVVLSARGGADDFDDDDEEEDAEEDDSFDEDSEEDEEEDDSFDEESEEDDELFSNFDLDGNDSDDFKEDNIVDRFIQEFHRTPPLTKAYLTSSFVATAMGFLFTENEFPQLLSLDWNKAFKGFQIWRPFTAFLNLGSFGLIGYPMTVHFVHQYMSFLERTLHNKPYDFWIMILFGMISMLVGYPMMKMNARFLGHNLSTFLVYIWSRSFEGLDVGVFDFINIKAELLPWFLLAQTFLLEGEPPILDFLGIVFGHVYYHFKMMGMLRAPDWLKRWYDESANAQILRDKYKTISSDFGA